MTPKLARWAFLNCLALSIAALAPTSARAAEGYLDYLFRSPALAGSSQGDAFSLVIDNIDKRQYQKADELMDDIMGQPATQKLNPVTRAKLMTDAGILKALTRQDSKAIPLLTRAVQTIVEAEHSFSPLQFNALMVEGMVQARADNFPAAIDAFRRAQHVLHLQDGVYTPKQIPVLEQLTRVDQARGTLLAADIEQGFDLRIVERAYGANSEAVIPTLEQVGRYFALRGDALPTSVDPSSATARWLQDKVPGEYLTDPGEMGGDPGFGDSSGFGQPSIKGFDSPIRYYRASLFDKSVDMYKRAIRILENKYGADDPRLVQPLRGLSRTRLLEGGHDKQSKQALERATNIVMNNPSTDLEDRVESLVRLGDLYTITGDSRAGKRYLDAWQLLRQQAGTKNPENQLFAEPERLFPAPVSIILDPRPASAKDGEPLYTTIRFTVDRRGRPRSVKVIDGNVPVASENDFAIYFERYVLYRPRIVDGKLVNTKDVTYRQRYTTVSPTRNRAKSAGKATSELAKNSKGKP